LKLRRFIYLISPNKINQNFYQDLSEILSTKKVKYFQLRFKKCSNSRLIKISKKVRIITKKYKVKLIINDFPFLAKKVNADGCHLGQLDGSIDNARKVLKKNKIVGLTCHGSKQLILSAVKKKPNYIAIGSFFKSRLKPNARKAKKSLIKWTKKITAIPVVAIGGINNKNYESLIKTGVNYLAISSFIWNNPRLKPKKAIDEFRLK
jgi:thiamine-phosphate pyrophosphorylase